VLEIHVDIQKRQGATVRGESVSWNGTTIWQDGDTADNVTFIIDRHAEPLLLEAGTSSQLDFVFNRDADRIDLYITYVYKIAGADGLCEFAQILVQ
jgi:hypothetical protein